jgi:hypothetical protein
LVSDPNYLTFGKPSLIKVPFIQLNSPKPYNHTLVKGDIDLSTIENIGQSVWNFIQANRPSVDIQTNFANAVPTGITDWTQLEGWQDPVSNCYQITYKNGFDMTVVSFTYCVVFTPGGDYNGTGQYLNHIQIIPSDINVDWGYTLNAVTSISSVINAGSHSNPIAAAEVHMKYIISTSIKKDSVENVYYVKGDGSFTSLN